MKIGMSNVGAEPLLSHHLPVTRPRRSLFLKYFVTLFVAVVVPLILGAISEAWFGYRDQRLHLNEVLQVESRSAADRIQTFIDGIRDQLGWVVQFPWTEGEDDRHRIDALRLLQQVPAIVSIALVDQTGTERVFASRLSLNRRAREQGLVRPRSIPTRFRALHENRGRRKSCIRRDCHCRHQPSVRPSTCRSHAGSRHLAARNGTTFVPSLNSSR